MKGYYENERITDVKLKKLTKTAMNDIVFINCVITSDTNAEVALPEVPLFFKSCTIRHIKMELSSTVTIEHSGIFDCQFIPQDIDVPMSLFLSDCTLSDVSIKEGIDLHWCNVLGKNYTISGRTRRYMMCLDGSMISVYFRFRGLGDITYDVRSDVVHYESLYGNSHTLKQFKQFIEDMADNRYMSLYGQALFKDVYKMFKRVRKTWLAHNNL